MEILFSFLNWVASFSHIDEESGSKMDIHNLATVITPNILYPKNKDGKDGGEDTYFLAIEAINTLIEYNEQMCEVPEDIISLLDDSNLYANSAELTTKDILKRYGEIVNRPSPARIVGVNSEPPPKSRDGRGNAPVYHRVEADGDNSNNAWHKESAVKHAQMPPQPSLANPADNGNRDHPFTHTRGNSQSSHHSDTNGHSNGSLPDHPNNRNSHWGRQPSNQQQNSLGISNMI